jgi:radical SAM superfamily enzyme YgiQ (UPF0313 family)
MANCIILTGGTWTPEDQCNVQRSLGPYRIATCLEDAGYTTFVLDFIVNLTTDEIISSIAKHLGPDTLWVGFSSSFFWPGKPKHVDYQNIDKEKLKVDLRELNEMYYTPDYAEVKKVINYVKSNSGAKLVYGGARAQYFVIDKNIDYYVVGNADNSVTELTDLLGGNLDKLSVARSVTIDNTVVTVIDSADYAEPDTKNISTKWFNKNFNVLHKEGLPLELARGCIFKCKFCDYQLIGKKKGTYLRSIDQVRDEMIKTWEVSGTDSYYFTDDTFNDDNDKLEELHRMFTSLPFKPKFSSYLRIDLINRYPHQAELLTEMGLVGTFFGLETMQPESAKSIGKGLHPNKVKDRLYQLNELWKNKVNIEAGFILGLPYDSMAYFNELLSWTLEDDNPIQNIHYYPLYLFNRKKSDPLSKYVSEFSLNPEIYGYTFDGDQLPIWTLASQRLNYRMCLDIATKFNDLRNPMNKLAGFHVITAMNSGIALDDIYQFTMDEIKQKYNIPALNKQRLEQYKLLVGI